jgi:hypothetical protein
MEHKKKTSRIDDVIKDLYARQLEPIWHIMVAKQSVGMDEIVGLCEADNFCH